MKRALFLLVFLSLFLIPVQTGTAQTPATSIQSMDISFWPDYDDASVLVLLTGTLPPDAGLPATVTLPLPQGAEINAVARIDAGNTMRDDVNYDVDNGVLTFTTPDRRFRVEYYMPYEENGNQREFTYTWLTTTLVDELVYMVQRPAAATQLITDPAAAESFTGDDGLTYYVLPSQAAPAGQPIAVTVNYTMSSDQLTASTFEQSPATGASAPAAAEASVAPGGGDLNWPLILAVAGLVLVITVVTWQVATRQGSGSGKRTPKPKPQRQRQTKANQSSASRFCHMCGQPASANDRFCRSCGTELK